MSWPAALTDLLSAEAATEAPPEVLALAAAARAEVGPSAIAVLFYGSALRDRAVGDRLVDLYVITDGYDALPGAWIWRMLVRIVPPNVYYIEAATANGTARAKYAVVSLSHLERLVSRDTDNPYFWARFAQPVALAWVDAPSVRSRLTAAFAQAADTLLSVARPLAAGEATAADVWKRAFAETYRTELRAEPPGRSEAVYSANAQRYDAIFALLRSRAPKSGVASSHERRWRRRRWIGKLLSVLRLAKAAFTFRGGADYIAWKIARHSGVQVHLTEWQRRHPLLTGITLSWRLYRARAFR